MRVNESTGHDLACIIVGLMPRACTRTFTGIDRTGTSDLVVLSQHHSSRDMAGGAPG